MDPDFEIFLWTLSMLIFLVTGMLLGLLVNKFLGAISFGAIGLLIAWKIKYKIEED